MQAHHWSSAMLSSSQPRVYLQPMIAEQESLVGLARLVGRGQGVVLAGVGVVAGVRRGHASILSGSVANHLSTSEISSPLTVSGARDARIDIRPSSAS